MTTVIYKGLFGDILYNDAPIPRIGERVFLNGTMMIVADLVYDPTMMTVVIQCVPWSNVR